MSTTTATAESVPGFWKKRWNAFKTIFKRDKACAGQTGQPSATHADEAKPQEKQAGK
jgi:hypothetical protein